jgi:hypothetical protein
MLSQQQVAVAQATTEHDDAAGLGKWRASAAEKLVSIETVTG